MVTTIGFLDLPEQIDSYFQEAPQLSQEILKATHKRCIANRYRFNQLNRFKGWTDEFFEAVVNLHYSENVELLRAKHAGGAPLKETLLAVLAEVDKGTLESIQIAMCNSLEKGLRFGTNIMDTVIREINGEFDISLTKDTVDEGRKGLFMAFINWLYIDEGY